MSSDAHEAPDEQPGAISDEASSAAPLETVLLPDEVLSNTAVVLDADIVDPRTTRMQRLNSWLAANTTGLGGWEFAARLANFSTVTLCCVFVFKMLHPELIFTNTTPTGGDMGSHVWLPMYIRDHLIGKGRLYGWTNDWYAGMPAGQFYFPLPTIFMLILNIVLPYNEAFKLVTVLGPVTLPLAVYIFGKGLNVRRPGPACMAIATLPFLFDRGWQIYGSNIASAMAGMYSNGISLSFAFAFLGTYAYALRTGKRSILAAFLFAGSVLSHVVPVYCVLVPGAILITILYMPNDHRVRVFATNAVGVVTSSKFGSRIAWYRWRIVAVVASLGGALTAFWVLPFVLNKNMLTDMGWSPIPTDKKSIVDLLMPPNNPGGTYYSEAWVIVLAVVGAIITVSFARRVGIFCLVMAIGEAFGFWQFTQGRIWNARVLPFWYLFLYLLAGLAIAELLNGLGNLHTWIVERERTKTVSESRELVAFWMGAILSATLFYVAFVRVNPFGNDTSVDGSGGVALPNFLIIIPIVALIGFARRRFRQRMAVSRDKKLTENLIVSDQLVGTTSYTSSLAFLVGGASSIVGGFLLYSKERQVSLAPSFRDLLQLVWFKGVSDTTTLNDFFQGLAGILITIGAASIFLAVALFVEVLTADRHEMREVLAALSQGIAPLKSKRSARYGRIAPIVGVVVWFIAMFVVVGMPNDVFGNVARTRTQTFVGEKGPSYSWLPLRTNDNGYVRDWAKWNFNGYQRKVAFPEFEGIMSGMNEVGSDHGCGRAMWDYEEDLTRFGTPMALMTLPHFTNGCIGSMEGVYFESSASTPYHFINTVLSGRNSSRPMLNLAYPSYDLAEGVKRLQLYGVRYYMTFDPVVQNDAKNVPDLELVKTIGPYETTRDKKTGEERKWNVYLIHNNDLVVGLANEPALFEPKGDADASENWLRMTVPWYLNNDLQDVFVASSGPKSWQTIDVGNDFSQTPGCQAFTEATEWSNRQGKPVDEWLAKHKPAYVAYSQEDRTHCTASRNRNDPAAGEALATLEKRELPHVDVSDINLTDDSMSFHVDRVGVPVLVKMSYFPNWKVDGADGPYRVSPNLMVVIPRQNDVKMHYDFTPKELLGYALTISALLASGLLLWKRKFLKNARLSILGLRSHHDDHRALINMGGYGVAMAPETDDATPVDDIDPLTRDLAPVDDAPDITVDATESTGPSGEAIASSGFVVASDTDISTTQNDEPTPGQN